jgi:hypothetical protein
VDQTPKRMYLFPVFCKSMLIHSAELKFETFSPQEIRRNGVVELTSRDLYLMQEAQTTDRVPAPHGPLDLRLVSSAAWLS